MYIISLLSFLLVILVSDTNTNVLKVKQARVFHLDLAVQERINQKPPSTLVLTPVFRNYAIKCESNALLKRKQIEIKSFCILKHGRALAAQPQIFKELFLFCLSKLKVH